MTILAIETSCDETALAVVACEQKNGEAPRFFVEAEVVASQIDIHRPFHGVVPSLAKREHLKNLPIVYDQILQQLEKNLTPNPSSLTPDMIAVTVGPGLEPALWTGINFVKELAEKLHKPLVGANHLEGHLYSNWLPHSQNLTSNPLSLIPIQFPAIALIVSGGHTILLRMDGMKSWEKFGETQDDAAGEAFDKVARMLGLPYPGGPEVERAAALYGGTEPLIDFPRPMLHSKDYNFSFSGLKTAVLYHIQKNLTPYPSSLTPLIAASFQKAAVDVLSAKTMRAAEEFGAQSVLLCGGVAANSALRERLRRETEGRGLHFFVPEMKYNTDNAVMIAAAAYLGNHYPLDAADGNLSI